MDETVGDGRFKLFLSFARPLIAKLKVENEKDLATRWMSRIAMEEDASLKQRFITFLTYQLTTNKLYGIFLQEPPSNDDSLPSLPPDFDEVKMYEYVCEKAATNPRSLPEIRTLSSDEQTFQAMQIAPGSGLRVYTVVSDEPYSMWPKPPDTIPPLATQSSSGEQLNALTEFIQSEASELCKDSHPRNSNDRQSNAAREMDDSQMNENAGTNNNACAFDEDSTVRHDASSNKESTVITDTSTAPNKLVVKNERDLDVDKSVVNNERDLDVDKSVVNNERDLDVDKSVVNNESGLSVDTSKYDTNTTRSGRLYSIEYLLKQIMSASSLPYGKRGTLEQAIKIYRREKNLPADFQPSWEFDVRNPFLKFLRYYIFGQDGPELEAGVTKDMRKKALRLERRDYYKEGTIHPHLATLYEVVEGKKKMMFSKSSQEDVDDFLDFVQNIPGDDITPLLRRIKEPKPTQSKDVMERMGHFAKRERKFNKMRQRTRLYMTRNSVTGETRVAHFSDTYADLGDISSDESEYDYKDEDPYSFTRRDGDDNCDDEEESYDCDDNVRESDNNCQPPKVTSSARSIPHRSESTENIGKNSDSRIESANNICTNGSRLQDLAQETNTRRDNPVCPRIPECPESWYDREQPPLDFEMPNFDVSTLRDREKIRDSLHVYDVNLRRVDRFGRPIVSDALDTVAHDARESNRYIPPRESDKNKIRARALTAAGMCPSPIRDARRLENTRRDYAQSTPNEKYANRAMELSKFYKSRESSSRDLISDEPYPEDFYDLPDSSNSRGRSSISKKYSRGTHPDNEASCPQITSQRLDSGRSSFSLDKSSRKESNNCYDLAETSRRLPIMQRPSRNSRCPRSKSFAPSSRDLVSKEIRYPSLDDSRENIFDEKFPDIPDIGDISGEFGSFREPSIARYSNNLFDEKLPDIPECVSGESGSLREPSIARYSNNLFDEKLPDIPESISGSSRKSSRIRDSNSRNARSLSVPNCRGAPDAQLRRNSVLDLKTRYADFMAQMDKVASTKFR